MPDFADDTRARGARRGRVASPSPIPAQSLRSARCGLLILVLGTAAALAHPTGSMLFVDDVLLWSYVCPVDSLDHRACVMAWDPANGVRPWLVSDRPASDWMLAPTDGEEILLIERWFDARRDGHRARLLAAVPLGEPRVVWDEFDDPHRFGEAGFAALPDGRMLFVRYPAMYTFETGSEPEPWAPWTHDIAAMAYVGDGHFLLRSEGEAWIATVDGQVLHHWPSLLEEPDGDLPFMGNRIFDAAWDGSRLLVAYWGQRRFDVLEGPNRTTIHALEGPWLPHWVAVGEGASFLFASSLEPGNPIRPRLWKWDDASLELIWSVP